MATYSTNQFKPGLKLMFDGDPYTIIDNEFVKPGKGQAFNRIKIRNLKTGRVIEKTMKSNDSAEGADVVDLELQFLYSDGDEYHSMNTQTFDQIIAPAAWSHCKCSGHGSFRETHHMIYAQRENAVRSLPITATRHLEKR